MKWRSLRTDLGMDFAVHPHYVSRDATVVFGLRAKCGNCYHHQQQNPSTSSTYAMQFSRHPDRH